MTVPNSSDPLARYHRQMLLPGIGEVGQRKLRASRVLILGCGALGSVIAETLARAGVGELVIVDRDFVELTNLQRQVLFDEEDLAQTLPKAEAARRKLARINSNVRVTAVIDDVNHTNIESLAAGCHAIVDGLDNFDTRFLVNDTAVKHAIPYVYGGAVATGGMSFSILPHGDGVPWADYATPCLRCIFGDAPPPGTGATCDTAGVLGPAVNVVASIQAAETIKILLGDFASLRSSLLQIDLWQNTFRQLPVEGFYQPGQCVCCGQGEYEYLTGARGGRTDRLCGRNAVQIHQRHGGSVDFDALAKKLRSHGKVIVNAFMLRAVLNDNGGVYELTLFTDGRAIIKGTDEPSVARSLYAKFVGH